MIDTAQSNLLAAAREAWRDWQASEDDQLERVLLIGRAMLDVRRDLLAKMQLDAPTGQRYAKAVSQWRKDNGFGDMSQFFCADATWLAENETEVRSYYAKACDARSKGRPSTHPSTLRQAVIRGRYKQPARRKSPTERPAVVVAMLKKMLDGMPADEALAMAAAIAELLEAAIVAKSGGEAVVSSSADSSEAA